MKKNKKQKKQQIKLIKKNKKGSYIHFKFKGKGNVISELEKNEAIDKKLLRYLTVRVKKFDLETNFFSKKDELDKKEKPSNQLCQKDKAEIKKVNKAILLG